ncbi:MAG: sel1 repeat family protein [Nitrosomonadales bacterium]|nr:sel1 repeat family protein [Nitrosomonadales bacterium]
MRKIILMMMLTIAGCGEKGAASKKETDAHPPQNTNLNSQFAAGPQAPEEKFAEMKRKAESGDAKSQFGLARMYYNGDGVTKDDARAAEWYRKTAEQGNDFAQYKLGAMYDQGEGVTKDATKAAEWWKKAAAQGNDAAQEALKQLQHQ